MDENALRRKLPFARMTKDAQDGGVAVLVERSNFEDVFDCRIGTQHRHGCCRRPYPTLVYEQVRR